MSISIHAINIDNFSYECYKKLAVEVTGTLFGLVLVLLAISVCLFRYRWEIRYFCLRFTQRSKQYQLHVNQQTHYDYDAFVVYDSGDRDWVNQQLLTNLEGDDEVQNDQLAGEVPHNMRLCVHERDFPPGEDILGNIWNKMEHSRKTILVLSKSFTRSHYCNYEVQLARMNSVEQARNLIIPVLLEPVDIKDMSECLRWIVRKLTYIEWPQHETDREEFWQKLRQSIVDYDTELFDYRLPQQTQTAD